VNLSLAPVNLGVWCQFAGMQMQQPLINASWHDEDFFLVLEKLVPAELIYTYQLYYINISLDLIPSHAI
jgi:hypothetical protein